MEFDFNNTFFNLQTYDFMLSLYQGKHAFYSILSALNSSHFKSGDLIFANNDITKIYNAKKKLLSDKEVVLKKNSINDSQEAKTLISTLKQLSMDVLTLSEQVQPVIEATNYASDMEKVNLLLASYGFVCYQRLHSQINAFDTATNLNLTDVIPNIQRQLRMAKSNVDAFDNFMQLFLSKQLIQKETYIQFWETAVTTDVQLKSNAHEIDKILVSLQKEIFEYNDYPYISLQEIEEWKTLKVLPEEIGYWKACDFYPKSASFWIENDFTNPFLCKTCLRYKITVDDAKLGASLNIPPEIIRRWLALGVDLKTGIERMKNGEMPALVEEGERML